MRDQLGGRRRDDDLAPVDQRLARRRRPRAGAAASADAAAASARPGQRRRPRSMRRRAWRSIRLGLAGHQSRALAAAVDGGGQEGDLLLVGREQLLVAGAVAGRAAGQLARARDRLVEAGQPLRDAGALRRAPARLLAGQQRAQLRDRSLVGGGGLGELGLRLGAAADRWRRRRGDLPDGGAAGAPVRRRGRRAGAGRSPARPPPRRPARRRERPPRATRQPARALAGALAARPRSPATGWAAARAAPARGRSPTIARSSPSAAVQRGQPAACARTVRRLGGRQIAVDEGRQPLGRVAA